MIDFPSSPTLGQIFDTGSLSYEWNGVAWISVLSSSAFIIPIDGTVTEPSLAWASEPGLGWSRPIPSTIVTVAGGKFIQTIGADTGTSTTTFGLYGLANPGVAGLNLYSNLATSLNQNILGLGSDSTRYFIAEILQGNAAPKELEIGFQAGAKMTAGQFKLQDGTVAAPGLSFLNEPGLGIYRHSASLLATSAQGSITSWLDASGPDIAFGLQPRGNGVASFTLTNQGTNPDGNFLALRQNADGTATLSTWASGAATRGSLTIDSPTIFTTGGIVSANNFQINQSGGQNSIIINQLVNDAGTYAGMQFLHPTGGKIMRVSSVNTLEYVNWANTAVISRMDDAGNWFGLSFTPTSDERLKSDIEVLEPVQDAFSKIQPISFVRNQDPESGKHWGFSAQNLHEVIPHAVVGKPDDGSSKFMSIDPVAILAVVVTELQNLINRVKLLEKNND
jgi:Chaperone of endosialidase